MVELTGTKGGPETRNFVHFFVDVVEKILDGVDEVLQQSLYVIIAVVIRETLVGTKFCKSVLEAKEVGMERRQFIRALGFEVGRTT